ncbi:MAG: hypothetical protein K6T16_00600 [Candidatus Pacearchaeota archaeon]|nr:hypothetical protein [Candidatus Pacearchaeota archaeon]
MALLGDFGFAMKLIIDRSAEIMRQPAINSEMLWILLPLLITLFLMELYFGRYTKAELGWNSAVGNSLVLFFVGMNLSSYLYSKNMLVGFTDVPVTLLDVASQKTFIAFVIVIESVFLVVLNFFRLVSKRFAFGISSELILNYIGVISIIAVYSDLPLDLLSLSAVIFIFIVLVLFFWVLRAIEPKVKPEEEEEQAEE